MTSVERDKLLAKAEEHFFAAMIAGWAGDVKATQVPDMPGYKQTRYESPDGFVVVDRYCTRSDSDKSSGSTTIWFEGCPVWVMHYEGSYCSEEIPFLKRALLDTYQRGEFYGGRGRLYYRDGDLCYINEPQDGSSFSSFQGYERIMQDSGQLGYHRYRGMSLLP